MTKEFFTNTIATHATVATIKQILSNPQQLLRWDPEVSTVNNDANGFWLQRSGSALNQREHIAIGSQANQIFYRSTGGRIAYDLIFTLVAEDGQTVIQESFYLVGENRLKLPLTLLAPIAKHAFNINLTNLAQLAETSSFSEGGV